MTSTRLPSLWEEVRIEELADLVGGGTPSRRIPEYFTGDIPWVTGYDFPEDRVATISDSREYITDKAIEESATTLVSKGTVLLTTRVTVGRAAVTGIPLCFSQDVTGLIIKHQEIVEPYYLAHCLLAYREQLTRLNRGTTITGVTRQDVARVQIPLPPLPEQRRLVEILRRADELRQLRRQANQRAQDLLPALFYEMFGDPATNPKGWDKVRLEEVSNRITDGTHQPPPFKDSGIPFLFVSNIVDGNIDFNTEKFISEETYEALMRRCPVERDDILYSTVGSYGVAVLVETESRFAFQRHIGHIKPNKAKVDPRFLCAMLNTPFVKAQADRRARGIAQKTVNLGEIAKFEFYLPPIELQMRFTERSGPLSDINNSQENAKERLDDLFESLLTRAFTGELTAAWREAHAEELAPVAAERDRLLGLLKEDPYTVDAATGRVAAINQPVLVRMVADRMEPAVRQFLEGLAGNQFLGLVAQLAWAPLAEFLRPIITDHIEVVPSALSQSIADLNDEMIAGLASTAQPLTESVQASLADAARQSTDVLSLALAREVAEMAAQIHVAAETPAAQTMRAVRSVLDPLTLSLLRAAENQPAYFRPEDVAQNDIGRVEAEERLQLLAALGFVRLVGVRGQLRYRLVDPLTERALAEGLLA